MIRHVSDVPDPPVAGPPPSIIPVADRENDEAADAVWLRVLEGLIAGIHHALNNRLGTVSAVSQVLEGDLPPGHPLAGSLSAEVRRMEDTVASLRDLGHRGGDATAIQLEPILERALQLFTLNPGTRDVSIDVRLPDGLLPLRVSAARLLRALLILLSAAAARTGPGAAPIRVRASGDDRWLELSIDVVGRAMAEPERVGRIDPAAAAALVRDDGGDLRIQTGPQGLTYLVRYPTLLEVRRRERVR
jgi:C4-dicarboxylate-specific signal transduction histidine kinase